MCHHLLVLCSTCGLVLVNFGGKALILSSEVSLIPIHAIFNQIETITNYSQLLNPSPKRANLH